MKCLRGLPRSYVRGIVDLFDIDGAEVRRVMKCHRRKRRAVRDDRRKMYSR